MISSNFKFQISNLPLAALVCFYIVMWVGGVGSHFLFGQAPQDMKWAAPVFLLLAALIVLLTTELANLARLLTASAVGFAAEAIGVRYGFVFGAYIYTGELGPQLFGVPLVMMCAWMALVAYADHMLPDCLPVAVRAVIAALWLTAIDLVIDPLAAGELGYWRWQERGTYYGIPASNFAGWFTVSLLIFGLVGLLFGRGQQSNSLPRLIGLSLILFFTFIALAHHFVVIAIIGVLLCFVHFILIYLRARMGRREISL
ncbi:MAG TPA: carotenoid biosynthesis protein [Blastocatellia bacterium]|nr:carotenoid biosynthesis protein [Blastocatellia bacterium]